MAQKNLVWYAPARWLASGLLFVLALSLLLINQHPPVKAAAGINETVNYQARLLTNTGAVVPDGSYNIEFKITENGDGCNPTSGIFPCSGTVKWTETREGGNKVLVKNGYFSVYLGSVTAFGSSVDWNQDTLWLSTNIGGTGAPAYDGVMKPLTRLSSSPYALNSKALGGLTSSNFVQLAQGVQTDSSATNPSIYINKTGVTANILQLQRAGTDVLKIDNAGLLTFNPQTDNASALKIQNAGATEVQLAVDTTARSASGGNIVKIGNSTGTDTATTLLQVDSTTADPSTQLAALNGGIFYNSTAGKLKIIENGVVKTLCNTTDAGCGAGGATAWDTIGDPSGNGAVALAETVQTLDWNTGNVTAAAFDGLTVSLTNDAVTDILTQRVFAVSNLNDGGLTGTTEALLVLNNADTNEAVGAALQIVNAGGGFTNIIDNAGTLISGVELNYLDAGIALGTETTGNYVANAATSVLTGLTGGSAGSVGASLNLALDYSQALSGDVGLVANAAVFGQSGLVFEGSGADTFEAFFSVTNPTADRTFTFPDRGGTLSLSGDTFTGDVTGTLNVSGATALTIAGNSVALTTDTTGDYVASFIAGGGLTGSASGEGSAPTLAIGAGSGITVNVDDITLDLTAATDALSSTTSSSSGLEVLTSGLSLLQGCSDTQILKWNETTDVWACAADDNGMRSRSFIDTTSNAVADNNTTEYWDVAAENNNVRPNLTPSATSKSIYGIVTVETQSTGNGDVEVTARVERNVGSNPTCNVSTQVGSKAGTFASNINARKTSTTTFLDSPATISQVFYTVCADVDTVGTTANITRLRVTLFEVDNSNADLAELYSTSDSSIQIGELVSLDPTVTNGVKRSSVPYERGLVGVISTAPALLIGGQDDGVTAVPVALSGRVPANVSTENGEIKPGDLLTSSSLPGVAMKATKVGPVVGQAMTGYSSNGIGVVMVFVGNGQGNGSGLSDLLGRDDISGDDLNKTALDYFKNGLAELTSSTTGLSEIVVDRLSAGLEVITPRITADRVGLNSIEAASGIDIELQLKEMGKFIIKNDRDEEGITFDNQGNATFTGTVTADKIKANQIEGLEILTDKISKLDSKISNQSQASTDVTDQTAIQMSSLLSNLTIEAASITLDLTIEGMLMANNGLIVNGLAQFNGESIFDKLVTFSDKSLFKGDASFEGRVTFNNDTAGFALIRREQQEVKIKFDKPYSQVPAVTLTIKNGKFLQYAYKDLTEKGFTIILAEPASEEIEFSWVALSVKNAKVAENKIIVEHAGP